MSVAGRGLRRQPTGLLVDCDGVLRAWDPAWPLTIEEKYALPPGALMATAMAPERLVPAILGEVGHEEWMAGVAADLGSAEAIEEWETYRGELRPAVVDLIADLRAAGIPVGLATNATSRLDVDLAAFGLTGAFDVVVNSSVLGAAKPQPDYYVAACRALGRPPSEVLLLDDSARFVAGARAAGLLAYRYSGEQDVGYIRSAFGL